MATRRGPDGTVRVAMTGHRGASGRIVNVFWCNLSGGAAASQADFDTWTLAFFNAHKTALQAEHDTLTGIDSAQAVLFQTGGLALHSIQGTAWVGTKAGTATSANETCRVISWNAGAYWRGGKPRTYIAGGIESAITTGQYWSAGTLSSLLTQALAFRTAVNALSAGTITATQMGFVSFRSGNADRVPPVFYAITGARTHGRLGTQRRRLGQWVQ